MYLNYSENRCQEDDSNVNFALSNVNLCVEEISLNANIMILYKKQLATKQIFSMKFDEVDEYDFEQGMFEILENPKFIHLNFDLDSIINEEQLISTLEILERYKSVFGKYVYGGYSLDKNIAEKYKLMYDINKTSKNDVNIVHKISVHVVYPDTMISSEDLMKIMKYYLIYFFI